MMLSSTNGTLARRRALVPLLLANLRRRRARGDAANPGARSATISCRQDCGSTATARRGPCHRIRPSWLEPAMGNVAPTSGFLGCATGLADSRCRPGHAESLGQHTVPPLRRSRCAMRPPAAVLCWKWVDHDCPLGTIDSHDPWCGPIDAVLPLLENGLARVRGRVWADEAQRHPHLIARRRFRLSEAAKIVVVAVALAQLGSFQGRAVGHGGRRCASNCFPSQLIC